MDQGHPEADVINGMTEQNAGFTINGATKFVQIAEKVYCPQHIGGVVQPPPPQPAPNSPPPFFSMAGAASRTVGRSLVFDRFEVFG
jgi:Protein of unknown function (DUF732)